MCTLTKLTCHAKKQEIDICQQMFATDTYKINWSQWEMCSGGVIIVLGCLHHPYFVVDVAPGCIYIKSWMNCFALCFKVTTVIRFYLGITVIGGDYVYWCNLLRIFKGKEKHSRKVDHFFVLWWCLHWSHVVLNFHSSLFVTWTWLDTIDQDDPRYNLIMIHFLSWWTLYNLIHSQHISAYN